MPKETLRETIGKYNLGAYTPHPWDDFANKHFSSKNGVLTTDRPITVVNSFRERTDIFAPKSSQYDWGTKYLTSDCSHCPFFIAATDQLEPLRQFWRVNRAPKIIEPEDLRGICLYSQTVRFLRIIPKFLVSNTHRKTLSGCKIPSQGRLTRYEQRRLIKTPS